jgi:hypothetical protein
MDSKTELLDQLRIDRTQSPQQQGPGIRWRWVIIGILVVLVGVAGVWAFRLSEAGIPVHTAIARAVAGNAGGVSAGGSLLDASGYVVALRQATVSAKAIYKVNEVLVQ